MREQHGPIKEQYSPFSNGEGQSNLSFRNYELVRRIDAGGMGEVYLARQRTAFGRLVAIKIMRPDLVHDRIARQRFLREAEVHANLLHEHIPPLIEFDQEQGQLFFVTQYIAGGTLARRLQAGPLPLQEVYQLFTALLRAVGYIHRHGVVHRDLKPSNILLDEEMDPGQVYVRLIDFGIASDIGTAASPRLTQAGTEMGTVAYMAPERLSGVSAPSNDIYSLGIILYQMLTGQLPSSDWHVTLPPPLEYVINRCIAPDPEARFATAEEVLAAFEYAYKYLNTPQAQAQLQSQLQPQSRRAPQPTPSVPVSVPGAVHGVAPTPVRTNTSRASTDAGSDLKQEVKVLQRTDNIPVAAPHPQQRAGFAAEDYASPTVQIGPSSTSTPTQQISGLDSASSGKPPRTTKGSKNPLYAIMALLIAFILLAMAGIGIYEFQARGIVSASINFAPQVHAIKQVFHIKGSTSQSSINVNTQTIPVRILNSTKSGSQTGETTGQECLIPPFFDCQQVVSSSDVDNLSSQLRQNLNKEISQDLQQQFQAKNGTQVGTMQFIDAAAVANPPVGTVSKTVTVTINGQQGKMAYFSNSDAQALARLLLSQQAQKLGPAYQLVSSTVQVGEPATQGVDSDGEVLIAIAAAGVAEYHFPASQLQSIASGVKHMKQATAIAYIKRQPGVDASTVSVRLSFGDTLPANAQFIKIIPLAPADLPSITLPQVTPAATTTPSPESD